MRNPNKQKRHEYVKSSEIRNQEMALTEDTFSFKFNFPQLFEAKEEISVC